MVDFGFLEVEVSLTIKSAQAHALARRIADMTGETLTEAVSHALEERLARLEDRAKVADALLAIGRDCASRLEGAARHTDHGDLLYDSTGLPR